MAGSHGAEELAVALGGGTVAEWSMALHWREKINKDQKI